MLWRIEDDSKVPIYEQIEAQVIFRIADGGLRPGELIPSVRELAGLLRVHPNTVARTYQALEREGVVAARRGRGMEVTAEAPEVCARRREEIVRARIRDVLREALSGSLTAAGIRRLVEEELAGLNGRAKGE